jgi:hypothetical protein
MVCTQPLSLTVNPGLKAFLEAASQDQTLTEVSLNDTQRSVMQKSWLCFETAEELGQLTTSTHAERTAVPAAVLPTHQPYSRSIIQ